MGKKNGLAIERADVLKNFRSLAPNDEVSLEQYPTIVDLLSPRFKDGKCTRQGSRLAVKAEGAFFRVTIDCPTEGVMCTWIVGSLFNLLADFERHVRGPEACWTPNYDSQKKARPVVS